MRVSTVARPRDAALRRALGVVGCSIVAIVALGCAQGVAAPAGYSAGDFGLGTLDAAISGTPPPVDAGAMMLPEMTTPPPFMGVPCNMGDRMMCTCEDGVSMGVQVCRFDATSPTMGALAPCSNCMAPPMPMAGMGAAGDAAAGSGGTGGAAGAMSAGSGGAMSAGSGGSMSGGSGGMSGSGGSGGSMAMTCNPRRCPNPGLLLEACCTDRGECGGRLLLGSCRAN